MPTHSRLAAVLTETFCALLIVVGFAFGPYAAQAQTYTVISEIPGGLGISNPQGQAIAQGRDGNLYTTSILGGDANGPGYGPGTFFKFTPSGTTTLLTSIGYYVGSGVTLGTDGNFYGTNQNGGSSGGGQVFKVTPAGVETILYSFTGGTDGADPWLVPPIQATNGIFYGTTCSVAVPNSTVYSITSGGVFKTIHTFTGPDGQDVRAALVQGTDGNFYGGTVSGGTSSLWGVIFKMTPTGTVTVLHNFTGPDGAQVWLPLIQASDGNFYGVTARGGSNGIGVFFKITSSGTYTVLSNFAPGLAPPSTPLIQATDGNFYGGTASGGSGSYGTLYKLTKTGTFTVLHTFDWTDGDNPQTPLKQHTNGLLYGTTYIGGTSTLCNTGGCGVVFSLNIGAKPFLQLALTSGKAGTLVGMFGQGFDSASVVKFGGVAATSITLTGSTYIVATVPTGALTGKVTVTTGSTILTSSQTFTVHDSWTSGAAMPTALFGAASSAIGTKVYEVGGATSGTIVNINQIYNTGTNKWTTGAAMPTARFTAAGAVVNGILYVIGGNTNGSTQTNVVEAYNPTTNTWSTKAPMPTARDSVTVAVEGGKIYVIGGYASGSGRLATVESYNPATNTWATEAPLLVGKSAPAVGLLGTTIVAAGGLNSSGITGDNEGYSASKNTWTTLVADPTPRQAGCAVAITGLLYSAGGTNGTSPLRVNESFSATTKKWTTLSSMPQAVVGPGSAVAGGLLYCFGGSSNGVVFGGTVYNNVQIYRP